jgi:hypothetical protein
MRLSVVRTILDDGRGVYHFTCSLVTVRAVQRQRPSHTIRDSKRGCDRGTGGLAHSVRQQLADARAATKDARLLYLSHVAAAICADRMGDVDAVAVHAGAAVTAIPGAQTGATLLAVASIRRDRHEAASDALAAFYSAGVDDPWLSYRFGDGYRWPEYRDRLREAVRR